MALIRRVQNPGRRTTETGIYKGDWDRSFHPEGGRYWACGAAVADLDRILTSTDVLKRIPGEKTRFQPRLGGLYMFPPEEVSGGAPVHDVAAGRADDTDSRPVILAARKVHPGLHMAFDEDVLEWLRSDAKEREAGNDGWSLVYGDFVDELEAAPRLKARLLNWDGWGHKTVSCRREMYKLTRELWNFGGGFEKLGRTFRFRILSPVRIVILDAETIGDDAETEHGGLVVLYCDIEPGLASMRRRTKLARVKWD